MGLMQQKLSVRMPKEARVLLAAMDESGISSMSGAARRMLSRMVGRMPFNARSTGGKPQTDQAIMTGPDAMRGRANWLEASPRPPRLDGADAYRGTSSSMML